MTASEGRMVVVVNGRVLELPVARSAQSVRIEGSVAWWASLAVLGAALLVLGVCVGLDLGSAAAITGVGLFLATAVLAGSERYEYATALGVSAVVWTSLGIAVYRGTDTALLASLVAFFLVGITALVAGAVGAVRKRTRDSFAPSGPRSS